MKKGLGWDKNQILGKIRQRDDHDKVFVTSREQVVELNDDQIAGSGIR